MNLLDHPLYRFLPLAHTLGVTWTDR